MSEVTKITVNGREYDSVEQMPPEVRAEYLQVMAAMREAGIDEKASGAVIKDFGSRTEIQESFVFNGREYKSREDLPPEARALLEKIPEPTPADKTSNVEIRTVKTFKPELSSRETWVVEPEKAPEKEPAMAWLLVKILVAMVAILACLLFWLKVKSKG
jgi:hypothetical protein